MAFDAGTTLTIDGASYALDDLRAILAAWTVEPPNHRLCPKHKSEPPANIELKAGVYRRRLSPHH